VTQTGIGAARDHEVRHAAHLPDPVERDMSTNGAICRTNQTPHTTSYRRGVRVDSRAISGARGPSRDAPKTSLHPRCDHS
jgi:hypothetical protein